MEQDTLAVAVAPPAAYVQVHGRGSFKVSPALKKFVGSAIGQGCRTIVMDMADCLGMDSTFMGVLAGIAMRLRKDACPGEVVVINLDAKNTGLLETLGLSKVVRLLRTPLSSEQRHRFAVPLSATGMEPLNVADADRETTARTMLAAHEDLVEVSPENLPRFQDVLAYLKADIRRGHATGGGED